MVACARGCAPVSGGSARLSAMVVPVSGSECGSSGRRPSQESQKPKIISELMKRSGSSAGARCGRRPVVGFESTFDSAGRVDRPRMCGVLHCARSEWSPRWEPRYVRVCHGSLEVYLTEERGGSASGTRPRRRLPLRDLSLRRVPRRQHAFALCPREVNASPLLLCQADDAEGFSRWTQTLAVELMKQTPLGDVRFLDILRITEPPHPDDEPLECDPPLSPDQHLTNEVERLKELCQRGCASVHERRRLFEALGCTSGSSVVGVNALEQRKQLSSRRPCASSEDLGQQPPCKSVVRSRAKRAKSLHDLPSDFPVPCADEGSGGPVSVVSQLRLFFERMGRKGEEAVEESGVEDGKGSSEGRVGQSSVGRVVRGGGVKGQSKKTARSQSYTCEGSQGLVGNCYASCENDNVFPSANQKLGLGKDTVKVERDRNDLTRVGSLHQQAFTVSPRKEVVKEAMTNTNSKYNSFNGKHDVVKINTLMIAENVPSAANVTGSSNSQPSSLSHSLSSESLTSSILHSVPSPSSSCSSLSLNLSTPSSSPNSQLSQQLLSVIRKQTTETEANIESLQEEIARLDRERIAAQSDEKKVTRKSSTPKRTYCELEAQLHEEETKLDKLGKEAERVLKIIERSVKHEAALASFSHCQRDQKWRELNNNQKFNLRSLTS